LRPALKTSEDACDVEDVGDVGALRRRIIELEGLLAKRDARIRELEARLALAPAPALETYTYIDAPPAANDQDKPTKH
jgi:hypothetical protein